MKTKRFWAALLAVGLAAVAFADHGGSRNVAVDDDPAVTVTLTEPVADIAFFVTAGDPLAYTIYTCDVCGGVAGRPGQSGATCSDITWGTGAAELTSTQAQRSYHHGQTEGGAGYCGYSMITEDSDGATVTVEYK